MARKTATIVIEAEGRDRGKQFLLREMPASQAEKWAFRALLALARAGIDLPDDPAEAGLPEIARIGLAALGGMAFDDAEPLMDEMMACVQAVPDPSRPAIRRPLIEDDIEEVSTRLVLRREVFQLHVGFSIPAAPWP
ncbi:hypothetical protein GALL_207710 [mine drainage metagenome]|uniref:Uncharacterized protein n=1 Tax=mine drainage metagenome TaxID=410659 RepID=A0A1J5RNA8_9ZZZZ